MSNIMLYDWLDKWLHVYAKNQVANSTYNTYRCSIINVKTVIADMPIERVREVDLQQAINQLCDKRYSKSTLHTTIVALNQAFKKACKNLIINNNVCDDLYIPRDAPTKVVEALTISEQFLVEKGCYETLHGEKYRFLLLTAIRRGELCELLWSDYLPEQNVINIKKSKTAKGIRRIPLLPEAKAIIETQPRINEHIFNSSKGDPITPSVLKKTYQRLRKITGLSQLTNHICRHTMATRMVEAEVAPKALSSILGHSSVAFTMTRYVHAQDEYLASQMGIFEQSRKK